MGLLDDAIREHLDLKRRRGADPAEVARMEQEALGPVRREPTAAEPATAEPQQPAPPAEPPAEEERPHPVAEQPHPEEATHVLAPEDRHEPPHGDPLHEQHAQPDPRHGDVVHQPTTEFRVEDHHDDAPADPHGERADEDVLEETPDFLQETPEHDRLWFEQRPPRDFDFDG